MGTTVHATPFRARQYYSTIDRCGKTLTVRVKDISPEWLQQWFDDLKKVIAEYNIKRENKYNMDETGFGIGEKEPGHCIIDANIKERYQAKPGCQEWVTVV